MNSHWNKFIVF